MRSPIRRRRLPAEPPPGGAPPYSRVLCPVDFTWASTLCLATARALTRTGARIDLLHVRPPGTLRSGLPAAPSLLVPDGLDRARSSAAATRARLEALAADLGGDRRVTSRVAEGGDPARTILAFARRHDAECVVVASHGRRGVERWLLGSVASTVARRCDVPVVIVQPGRRRAKVQAVEAAHAVSGSARRADRRRNV